MKVQVQAMLSGAEADAWEWLMEDGNYRSQGALIRALVAAEYDRLNPPDDSRAIIGWSEIRIARQVIACCCCDKVIAVGDAYRVADTVGSVDGIFAHDRCTEDE